MITKVVQWSNGMVTVFNENGEQIPEYQGRRSEVANKIKADLPADQIPDFAIGDWNTGIVPTTPDCFFSEGWGDPK